MTFILRAIVGLWVLLTLLIGLFVALVPHVQRDHSLSLLMQARDSARWQQWLFDVDSGVHVQVYEYAALPERARQRPIAFYAYSAPDFENMMYVLVDGYGRKNVIGQYPRAGQFALSADGAVLVTMRRHTDSSADETTVHRITLDDGQREQVAALGTWSPYAIYSAPDGEQVALQGMSPAQRRGAQVRLAGHNAQPLTLDDADAVAWSPDGQWLIVQSRGPSRDTEQFRVIDRYDGQTHPAMPVPINGAALTWSPDGTAIYFSRNGHIQRLDLNTATNQLTDLAAISWSPDGRHALHIYESPDDDERTLHVIRRADEQTVLRVPAGGLAAWSADGTRLALLDPTGDRLRLYRLSDGALLTQRSLALLADYRNLQMPFFLH